MTASPIRFHPEPNMLKVRTIKLSKVPMTKSQAATLSFAVTGSITFTEAIPKRYNANAIAINARPERNSRGLQRATDSVTQPHSRLATARPHRDGR
jgi:hypothetical protein